MTDHRDHRHPQGRNESRDPGLHRRRVPRGQPVRRAGAGSPRPRDAHTGLLSADRDRAAPDAVLLTARVHVTVPPTLPSPHSPTEGDLFMTLTERLTELVRAAFSGLWIQSHEHDDAIAEIATLCRAQGWTLATWDIDRGLAVVGAPEHRLHRGRGPGSPGGHSCGRRLWPTRRHRPPRAPEPAPVPQ